MNVVAWTAITSLLLVEGMNMLASAWIVMITSENHVVVLTWPAIMSILLVAGTDMLASVRMVKIINENHVVLLLLRPHRAEVD